MSYSIKSIFEVLAKAARLESQIVCIYGSETIPEGAVPVSSLVHDQGKCFSKALFNMAMAKDAPPVYVGGEGLKECCWAAAAWLGYSPMPPGVEEMLSAGDDMENGRRSKFLKSSATVCRESLADIGEISPIGPYLVAQQSGSITDLDLDIRSVLCFGSSEQIRILCALVHFGATKIFTPISGAWGSGCATFVTYPAGLGANCPKETAFLSPMGPEVHDWFPEDQMALGIPIGLAERMAQGYPRSFAVRCPEETYPEVRGLAGV